MTDFEYNDLSVANESTENFNPDLSWADKKFGAVCKKCGVRHAGLSTPGENLPNSRNKCNE